jgi:heat shock protein HslJ
MKRLLVLLAVAALTIAACGDDADDVGTSDDPGGSGATEPATEPGGTAEVASPVSGGELVATSITEGGEERPLVAGTELRLVFTPVEGEADALPQLGISAGCNQMSASYDLVGDTFTVGQIAQTQMACEPELMDQDAWIAEALTGEVGWSVDGDTVTLTSGDVVITLVDRRVASPDAELVGPTWVVDTLITGADGPDGAASTVPEGVVASVTFGEDGRVLVATGCNTGNGDYTLAEDGSSVSMGPLLTTRAGCTDEGAEQVERTVLSVLDGVAEVEISEQRLTLTNGADAIGLTVG